MFVLLFINFQDGYSIHLVNLIEEFVIQLGLDFKSDGIQNLIMDENTLKAYRETFFACGLYLIHCYRTCLKIYQITKSYY